MILDNHYAVVFKPTEKRFESDPPTIKQVMTKSAYGALTQLAKAGHFVILEAWDITNGKCVSN